MTTLTAHTPLRQEHCIHKLPTSCRLTALPICCACQDRRPHASAYRKYIDGVGFVNYGTRQEQYCWPCKVFWDNRVAASGIPQANTRIPERPDLTSFLKRWYDWHRGYEIVLGEDGIEQRKSITGENLADIEIGHLPRTNDEIEAGRHADGERDIQTAWQQPERADNRDIDLSNISEEDRLFDFEDTPENEESNRPQSSHAGVPLNSNNVALPERRISEEQLRLCQRLDNLRENTTLAFHQVVELLEAVENQESREDLISQQYTRLSEFQQRLLTSSSQNLSSSILQNANNQLGRDNPSTQTELARPAVNPNSSTTRVSENPSLGVTSSLDDVAVPEDPRTWDRPSLHLIPAHNVQPQSSNAGTTSNNLIPSTSDIEQFQNQVDAAQEEYNRLVEQFGDDSSSTVTLAQRTQVERAHGRLRGARRRLNRAQRHQQWPSVLGTRDDIQRADYSSPITNMFARVLDYHRSRQSPRSSDARSNIQASEPSSDATRLGYLQPVLSVSDSDRDHESIQALISNDVLVRQLLRDSSQGAEVSRQEQTQSNGNIRQAPEGVYPPLIGPLGSAEAALIREDSARHPTLPSTVDSTPQVSRLAQSLQELSILSNQLANSSETERQVRAELQGAASDISSRAGYRPGTGGLDRAGTGRPKDEVTEDEKWLKMECKVCLQQVACVACVPCAIICAQEIDITEGHCAMCAWCSEEWMPSPRSDKTSVPHDAKCPVCRTKVRSKLRIYGSEEQGKRARRHRMNGNRASDRVQADAGGEERAL